MLSAKSASLIAGVLQQAALVLFIRYSKTPNADGSSTHSNAGHDQFQAPYLTSVAVASSEVFKLFLSCILEVITSNRNRNPDTARNAISDESKHELKSSFISNSLNTFKRMLRLNNRESAKLAIPAALYLAQNNLLFLALSNLSVPTYQVTSQGKLLTTTIISRIMLKKQINGKQYLAIVLLGLGVAVIHLSEYHNNMNTQNEKISRGAGRQQNQWLGLLAVLISCFTSGFAGVYFEYILKTTKHKQSLHLRNFQLAFWSFIMAVVYILFKDIAQVKSHGLFHGFDGVVVLVVVVQGITGFVASMMLYYAGAILKGFAMSVAAVLATVASIFLFGTKVNATFFFGAFMVGVAVRMYSYYDERERDERRSLFSLSRLGRSGVRISSWNLLLCSFSCIFIFSNSMILRSHSQDLKQGASLVEAMNAPIKVTSENVLPGASIANKNKYNADWTGKMDLTADKLMGLGGAKFEHYQKEISDMDRSRTQDMDMLKNSIGPPVKNLASNLAAISNSTRTEKVASVVPADGTFVEENNKTLTNNETKERIPVALAGTDVVKKMTPEANKTQNLQAQGAKRKEPEKCHLRDLSTYAVSAVGDMHRTLLKTHLKDANCLFFTCSKDATHCDHMLPTNYDGPEPPCCVHILRDMARIFDDAMCSLGLDYSSAFGTLLGLRRADRLIPWTADNDYIIPSKDVANAMVSLWDTETTGLAHIYQGINRICVTDSFAGGKLQRKWSIPPPVPGTDQYDTLHLRGFPYIDLYVGRNTSQDMFEEIEGCRHLYRDIFPTKRMLVYNGTFAQNIPANPEQVLRTYYGKSWSIPRSDENPHGATNCPYSPTH